MFPFLNVQEGNIKEVQSLLISVKRKMRGTTNQENQEVLRKTWVGIGSRCSEEKISYPQVQVGTSSGSRENMIKI